MHARPVEWVRSNRSVRGSSLPIERVLESMSLQSQGRRLMSVQLLVASVAGCLLAFACSSSDEQRGGGAGAETGNGGLPFGNSGGPGVGSTSQGGAGGVTIDACGSGTTASCVGNTYAGENLPLDIYVMFDQSCSMSCPAEQTGPGLCCRGGQNQRIDQVRTAVAQFLQDRDSEGIGVGIGFFGYMEAGQTSCDPTQYSAPAVRIGTLPNNAGAVLNALNRAEPTGETPTGAAIRGACTYADQYQTATPDHTTVVLLVTDGFPEAPVTSQNGGCTPSIPDAVQAAQTCVNAGLPVYVLGVGRQLQNLNQIAAAGGTDRAYLVEGANVSGAIVQALNEIRANAQIPCQLKLPPAPMGATLRLDTVNVSYCSPTKSSETFLKVLDSSQCRAGENTWHYNGDQTQIVLCDSACATVSRPGGRLQTSVGCATQSKPVE